MNTDNKIPFNRLPYITRKRLIWILWFVTWTGLLAGLYDRIFFEVVVVFTFFHAILFLYLHNYRFVAFPVQVRVAYFAWVWVGTYVPYMIILLYITMIGLATNLFLGYCPLARLLYLIPLNRDEHEPFSIGLVKRVFLAPPVKGKFTLSSGS